MRRPEADRGSATTEVVLLTPVLLFLIMAIIQFGLWYHAQHVAQAAAEQGVAPRARTVATAEDGRQRAEDFLAGSGSVADRRRGRSRADRDVDTATVEVRAPLSRWCPD